MKKLLYILLLFLCFFSKIQAQSSKNQPPKWIHDKFYHGCKRLFGVSPTIVYVNRGQAYSPCRDPNGNNRVDGSVFCSANFQIYIVNEDINRTYQYGDAAFAFLICHEFAHAMQHYWKCRYTNPNSELQADCLAAIFMYHMYQYGVQLDYSDFRETLGFAHSIGDYCCNISHGTPQMRWDAVNNGFQLAPQGLQNAINGAFRLYPTSCR